MPFGTLSALLFDYRYAVLIPGLIVHGPSVTVLSGLFIKLDIFDFAIVFPIIVGFNLFGDLWLYHLGKYYGEGFVRRFGKYVGLADKRVSAVKRLFRNHTAPVLLTSKMTNGLGFDVAVLFTAGLSRVPFWQYMGLNFIGECAWTLMLICFGYFASALYLQVNHIAGRISLIIGITLLAFAVVYLIRYLRAELLGTEEGERGRRS